MTPLTNRQRDVLDTIRRLTAERGYPPTVREIAAAEGHTSTFTYYGHLRALVRKGAIERDAGKNRGIRVVHP